MNGATTIWERWDSYTEKDGIKKGMNSFNHYSLGSCTEWMYEYCLGIRPDINNPAFKKVTFKPVFDTTCKITSASGYYDSPFGRINVAWTNNNGVFEYKVNVPSEIECIFDFSDMTVIENNSKCGEYIFKLK